MAIVTWTGKYDHTTFSDGGNWSSTPNAPGPSDYAVIGAVDGFFSTVISKQAENVNGVNVAAGCSLNINGGVFEVTGLSDNSTADGEVNVNNATLLADGRITGASHYGHWNIGLGGSLGAYGPGVLDVGTAGLELAGAISLSMTGGIIRAASGTTALYNADQSVIYGYGSLGAGTSLQIRNGPHAVIKAGAGQLLIDNAGVSFINDGLIEATYNGFSGTGEIGLVLEHAKVVNTYGTLEATSAPSGFETKFGLATTTIRGGTLATVGYAEFIALDANVVLDGGLHSITTAGTIEFPTTLAIEGDIVNLGVLLVPAGQAGRLLLAANTTLSGGGSVTLTDESANEIVGAASGVKLVSDNHITGAGEISGVALTNGSFGVIDATGANYPLFISTAGMAVTNFGLIEATGAAGLVILNTTVINAGGEILAGPGSSVNLEGAKLRGSGTARAELDTAATGLIRISNGSLAEIQEESTNNGVIDVASTGLATDLRILGAGATLSGDGTVTMSGPEARILGVSSAATLTNFDNTIAGTGFIGANQMTLINEASGVIDASTKGSLVVATNTAVLTNAGLMEATGGGLLVISHTDVDNLGGTIQAAVGSVVDLSDDTIVGGRLGVAGGGPINVNVSGGELDGASRVAVTIGGLVQVLAGKTLILDGDIDNTARLNTLAGSSTADLIVGADGVTLSGKGSVNLSNSLGNRIYGLATSDVLTNVDNHIDGAGLLGNGTLTLVNQAAGQIIGNQNLSLTIDTGANTIMNAGLIENVGQGGTLIKSALVNTGTLLEATAGTLTLAGKVTGTGVAKISGGTLYVEQAFGENVTFAGTTGVLKLGDSQAYTGKITALSKTGTNYLDLADIGYFSATTKASFSGTTASGVLTVTDGTHTAKITLLGNYTASTFTVSSDGHGGTEVIDPAVRPAPAASSLSFLTAMSGWGARGVAHTTAGETWRGTITALAAPQAHFA